MSPRPPAPSALVATKTVVRAHVSPIFDDCSGVALPFNKKHANDVYQDKRLRCRDGRGRRPAEWFRRPRRGVKARLHGTDVLSRSHYNGIPQVRQRLTSAARPAGGSSWHPPRPGLESGRERACLRLLNSTSSGAHGLSTRTCRSGTNMPA